jgi:hypothetical protein
LVLGDQVVHHSHSHPSHQCTFLSWSLPHNTTESTINSIARLITISNNEKWTSMICLCCIKTTRHKDMALSSCVLRKKSQPKPIANLWLQCQITYNQCLIISYSRVPCNWWLHNVLSWLCHLHYLCKIHSMVHFMWIGSIFWSFCMFVITFTTYCVASFIGDNCEISYTL